MSQNTQSSKLFQQAKHVIPGGVNSPVRSFKGVGGSPIFFDSAKGAHLTDVDGKTYIDYIGSWGPMILGHNHPDIVQAIIDQAHKALSFGAPTSLETDLAYLIQSFFPTMDLIRMVNSGTEATMSAIRLARGYTNRNFIVKFEGCYHGHSDSLLVKAGSGILTLGIPNSPGVPESLAEYTLTLPFNDPEAARSLFAHYKDKIAAVIIEPVVGNMNCILPRNDFLKEIRALCSQHGSVLIFDEVMTGFRVHKGGAQTYFDVEPDLTTLGKIIGGGLPVGAFGGKKEIMEYLAPLGPVYQAGTLSGNPLAMVAGIETLKKLQQPNFYTEISNKAGLLCKELEKLASKKNINFLTSHLGGMFGLFFTDKSEIINFNDVLTCNAEQYAIFFHALLEKGVYLAPSAFEAGFMSMAHTKIDIDNTIAAADYAFNKVQNI